MFSLNTPYEIKFGIEFSTFLNAVVLPYRGVRSLQAATHQLHSLSLSLVLSLCVIAVNRSIQNFETNINGARVAARVEAAGREHRRED